MDHIYIYICPFSFPPSSSLHVFSVSITVKSEKQQDICIFQKGPCLHSKTRLVHKSPKLLFWNTYVEKYRHRVFGCSFHHQNCVKSTPYNTQCIW